MIVVLHIAHVYLKWHLFRLFCILANFEIISFYKALVLMSRLMPILLKQLQMHAFLLYKYFCLSWHNLLSSSHNLCSRIFQSLEEMSFSVQLSLSLPFSSKVWRQQIFPTASRGHVHVCLPSFILMSASCLLLITFTAQLILSGWDRGDFNQTGCLLTVL